MTLFILLLSIGVGMIVGDCKEFLYRDGLNNELAYLLFKIIFTVVFCEINALIIFLNMYFKKYEKALCFIEQSKENSREKIKIENHTHETMFFPLENIKEKEQFDEIIDSEVIPEPVKPAKGRGRSSKRINK
jgi:hypothetical protein